MPWPPDPETGSIYKRSHDNLVMHLREEFEGTDEEFDAAVDIAVHAFVQTGIYEVEIAEDGRVFYTVKEQYRK